MADSKQPWGQLGDLEFELAVSPRSFSYQEKTSFAEIPRIDAKPLQQWVGDELRKIKMSFRFGRPWCDPDEQLRRLQDVLADHQPQSLILGSGTFRGYYLLESIDATLQKTDAAGVTTFLEVNVELTETVDVPEEDEPVALEPFLERTEVA